MRTIQISAGTHRTTATTVTALVEMLKSRGATGWVSDNVTSDISDALRVSYGTEHTSQRVSYALKWLEKKGYGRRVVHGDGGKRTLEFHLEDDVLLEVEQHLSDKTLRVMRQTGQVSKNGWAGYGAIVKESTTTTTMDPVDELPPTPYEDGPPVLAAPYRRTELMTFLNTWEQASPRVYRTWVDDVLKFLQTKGIGDG